MAIHLTAAAANRIRTFKPGAAGIRFGVTVTGCSGYSYNVEYADGEQNEGCRYESQGVSIWVRPDHLNLLDGTTIDFKAEGFFENFVFDNPNRTASCGCGESFTVNEQA